MHFKMSSAYSSIFCLGLNVLSLPNNLSLETVAILSGVSWIIDLSSSITFETHKSLQFHEKYSAGSPYTNEDWLPLWHGYVVTSSIARDI